MASPFVSRLLAALILVTSCGCSGSSGGGGPEDHGSAAGAANDAGGAGAQGSVGAGGGEITTADGGALAADTWAWVPVPGTRCADGSATGMGVRVHPGASTVAVYLEGGGACHDGPSCWQSTTAANIESGYGQTQFDDDITLQAGFLLGSSTLKVFAAATLVYIPYCTGDLHLGDGLAMYTVNGASQPTYHYGGHNVDLDIAVIAQLYPRLERVFLSGSSAGGYGSVGNQDAFARALHTRVDVIDDSGPPVGLAYGGTPSLPASWSPRLPPGCATCDSGPGLFAYGRATYPASRYGFLTFATDLVLPTFYGVSAEVFASTLTGYESLLAEDPNAKSFVVQTAGHVVLAGSLDLAADAALPAWISAMVTDDPAWSSASL